MALAMVGLVDTRNDGGLYWRSVVAGMEAETMSNTHDHTSQQTLHNDAVITVSSETDGYTVTLRLGIKSGEYRVLVGVLPDELRALQGQIDLILGQIETL